MSFDSMKRSNNRHNFIAKRDHGEMPSQSPFAKEVQKAKSQKTTTAVKWSEVDTDTRVSTAKLELRNKLKSRHSTTHQVVGDVLEPGAVGNPNKGLHPHAEKQSAVAGDAKARGKGTGSPSEGGGKDRKGFNFDGNESSDDETDVYGWRFDAEGAEDNDKALEYHPEESSATVGSVASIGSKGASLDDPNRPMLNKFKASFNKSMRSISEQFEVKQDDHPVMRTAKSLSQFAGSTLLKTASFAAKASVKIAHRLADDIGEYMSRDEHDQLGALVEKNASFMKIHDLENSPSKERFKKKRLEDLQSAVAEMRQFGEEREHAEAERKLRDHMNETSLVQKSEALLHSLAFPNPIEPPSPQQKPYEPVKMQDLGLQEHSIQFKPGSDAVPEKDYKTLLDVKDMSNFNQDYFSPGGKGIQPILGREVLHNEQSGNPDIQAEVNSVVSTTATSRPADGGGELTMLAPLQFKAKPQPQVHTLGTAKSFQLKRPPSLGMIASTTGAASRLRPSMKKGVSFHGIRNADWDMGKGPGAGLPPLRSSVYKAPPPELPSNDDMEPVYIKKLKQTGTFLKAQFDKAKAHLTAKLPAVERGSTPALALLTGKERIPPKPTSTNGFNGSRSYTDEALMAAAMGGDGDGDGSNVASGIPELENQDLGDPGRAPFTLRSTSSFMSNGKLSPKSSSVSLKDMHQPGVYEPNNSSISLRHKQMMVDSSPGMGTPVIYAPQTARSEASEESVYSHVSSLTNLLEVSDGRKASKFRPGSMKHLDLGRVAEVPEHELQAMSQSINNVARIAAASDVGPNLPEKDVGLGWRACWDFSAESVYYFNTTTGEATWVPPEELANVSNSVDDDETEQGEDFYRINNNGLPRGLSELNLGESDLTIKTRKIAARHNLFSKLRSRYEGDTETAYTKELVAKEYATHAAAEENEILNDLTKELGGWDGDEHEEGAHFNQ